MTEFEKRGIAFLKRHMLLLAVLFATVGTMYARWCLRDFISDDMSYFLLPWFQQFREQGGLAALSAPVGDYNIPYQVVIALFTYLPVRPEHFFKCFSILFDYLLAWAVSQIVYDVSKKRSLQAAAYIATVALPVAVLNSSAWGQCDVIYSFFCVLSILLLIHERYIWCFVAYAVGFAFKLQAIFLLPFLLFVWFRKRKFSILYFLTVPAVDIVMCLPALLAGQTLSSVLGIYVNQAGSYESLSVNYPSFWVFLQDNRTGNSYAMLKPFAILVAALALLGIVALLTEREVGLSPERLVRLAFLFVYTCVLFLPAMHERYSYLYMVLGIAVAALDPVTIPLYLGLLFIDLQTYGCYLFGTQIAPWTLLAALNTAVYAGYLWRLLVPMLREGDANVG